MKKILVAGSRTIGENYLRFIFDRIYEYQNMLEEDISIISGGAVGVDSIAIQFAQHVTVPLEVVLPDWKTHGKSAGYLRNKEMVEKCDVCIIFWDGKSKGTKHTIDLATQHKKELHIYFLNPEADKIKSEQEIKDITF